MHRWRLLADGVLALILAGARVADAQKGTWSGTAHVNASLFFGATDQRLVGTEGELTRSDSAWQVTINTAFRYGESSNDGVRTVQARSWIGALSADARPLDAWSPFFFGTAASSYEQRLARRATGGIGVKWTVVRSEHTLASVSAAVLGEHTRSLPSPDSGLVTQKDDGRMSLRVKLERHDERVTLTHLTMYQPRLSRPADALVTTTSRFSYALSNSIAATVTLMDSYDSGARARGARSNSDGQLLLGLAIRR